MVVADYGGILPTSRNELMQIPGIGAYTAGAILSLAHGQPAPVLDGNLKRIFSRLLDLSEYIDDRSCEKKLWDFADELVQAVPMGKAGLLNEGLMDLGAQICRKQQPLCTDCPLQHACLAAARGTQRERPMRRPRKATPHYDVAAGVIWQSEPFASPLLLAQRPQNGLLGGLWEFPGGKLEKEDGGLAACLEREIREELAIEIEVKEQIGVVRHAYTHFRITLYAFHALYERGTIEALGCDDWKWVELKEVANFPLPVTDQQILAMLLSAKS